MNYPELRNIMIGIALATPILALVIVFITRSSAARSDEPLPPKIRSNALILAVAGPLNLAVWLLFNAWHNQHGPGSVHGIVAAAIMFIAAGLATGFFARLFRR